MNGGERGSSEEMKDETTGRPAGTVTALTWSDLVPAPRPRGRTNLNVTMGSEAPALSVHQISCHRKPPLLFPVA